MRKKIIKNRFKTYLYTSIALFSPYAVTLLVMMGIVILSVFGFSLSTETFGYIKEWVSYIMQIKIQVALFILQLVALFMFSYANYIEKRDYRSLMKYPLVFMLGYTIASFTVVFATLMFLGQ